MKTIYWKLTPLAIFVLLAVFLGRGLFLNPQELPSVQIGKSVPVFSLDNLKDKNQRFTNQMLPKQVILLNVWASWCAACAEEQPFLMQLAHQGTLIYGINYKDDPESAKQWLHEWGNPYQVIGEDSHGRLAIDLGVYGTPETFLIDANGTIRYRHTGPLTAEVWENTFLPKIKELESKA